MSDSGDPDLSLQNLHLGKQENKTSDLSEKLDGIISVLGKEILSGGCKTHNVGHTLYQVLHFRTKEHHSKDFSSGLLSTCKCLIMHLTSHILIHNITEKHNEMLNVIELCFEIMISVGDDDTCYGYIQSFMKIIGTEDCSTQLGINQIHLFVFECLLKSMISAEVGKKINLPRTLDLLKNANLLSALRDLVLNFENHNLSSVVLYSLVPKLVKVTNTYSVINMLWIDLKSTSDSTVSHISFPAKLFALCGLADFIANTDDFSIIEAHEFWKLIQEGLISADTLLRKQALYLLKRAIGVLVALNMSFDVQIFSWNSFKSCTLQQTWENMFILYEVLEEKQSHLVIPVVHSLLKANDIGSIIHPSWIIAVYVRMLSHDSLQVTKLGVIHLLEMTVDFFLSTSYRYIFEILFQKLNNMLFYCSHSNTVEWSAIDITLREWFTKIASHPKLSEVLFPVVIGAMAKVQWCTIPLFHVLFNLSLAPVVNIFHDTDLIVMCDFLKEAIKTQNIFIRGAVQCVILNIVAKGTKETTSIVQIINTLNVFRQNECLERGLKSWETARDWISSFTLKDDDIIKLMFFEENNLPVEARARSLVLFVDSRLINPGEKKFKEALEEHFNVLKETYKRPYASSEESDRCLKWILHILKEFKKGSTQSFQQSNSLIDSISPYTKEAFFYIQKRLGETGQLKNFENIELYISVLQEISDLGFVSFQDAVSLNNISKELSFSPECHPVQRLLALKITVWFIRFGRVQNEGAYTSEQAKEHCLFILKNDHLQLNFSKSGSDELLSRNHKVHWGWLLSGYTCALWSILQECLNKRFVSIEEILDLISAEDIIQLAVNSIESGGRDSSLPVLKVVRYVLPEALTNCILCKRFLQFSWTSCFELRKIALFWPSIKAWVELTFNKNVILTEEMRSTINDFSEKILSEGEAVNGLSNVLLSHLRQELTDVETVKPLLPLLTKALVFGLVPRKDQRIESDTYALIGNLGSDIAINNIIPHPGYGNSQEVRLSALSVLLGVAGQDGGTQLVVSAVTQLMEMDKQLTAKRQRYHGDSLHHRIKHRILQAILVLHRVLENSSSCLTKSCLVELVKWASVGLQGESQQPSVRYQLEWLLVRVLLSSPQLLNSFWILFNESSEERTGSVCSFISVAFHLAATLRDAEFTDRCVFEVLPWCMAQQFNIRLYAQVVLDKLWPLNHEVAFKYKVVRSSLSKSLNQGNTMRNVEKLKNDFYFTMFHPLHHFTLETIFSELPRLSNISRDEWVPLSTIKESLSNYDSFLPLKNPDESLKNFIPSSWVVKATEAEVEVAALTMQKKFVPWKSMFPEMECSSSRTELIVVASLIDKLPNLGGLTRTCEIFAAECLVVPSLEFTKDKMFSTLSMTAEKHINIVEVKPYNLPEYLREKKSLGYTLVGVEQTASSVSLESYKFPKKCLLLLGNEKEGVPVNLLPLLDVCVEVPQLGVVRSLNVHVTGALFVWEYTKQCLDSGSERGRSSS